jgi:hypothetical protein
VAHRKDYVSELQEAIDAKTKDSNFINAAMGLKEVNFRRDVLGKLLKCKNSSDRFTSRLVAIRHKGLIGLDDYSFVAM